MKNRETGKIIFNGTDYAVSDPNCGLVEIDQEEAKQFKNNDFITYELEDFWHKNNEGKTVGFSKIAHKPKLKGEIQNETL